jgi:hypothetical protein
MLRTINDLEGYAIQATDGIIGHVKDLYFDDEAWGVRYLVVQTGAWLSSRKVLISPVAITHPNWIEKTLSVSMTQEQVTNCPDVDTEKPVSRQHEILHLGYYHYPYYWGSLDFPKGGAYSGAALTGVGYSGAEAEYHHMKAERTREIAKVAESDNCDTHLRSCKAVISYHIQALDGDIGHVLGLLVDEETWTIRYIIVDTSNWWLGRQVLIAPHWIKDVSWADATVSVNLTRRSLQGAPRFTSTAELDQKHEMVGLFKHDSHESQEIRHKAALHQTDR